MAYCETCDREFLGSLPITTHRAAHRRRGEVCVIRYNDLTRRLHDYRTAKEGQITPVVLSKRYSDGWHGWRCPHCGDPTSMPWIEPGAVYMCRKCNEPVEVF